MCGEEETLWLHLVLIGPHCFVPAGVPQKRWVLLALVFIFIKKPQQILFYGYSDRVHETPLTKIASDNP